MIKSNKLFLNSLKKTNQETRAHFKNLLTQNNDRKIT